MLEAAGPASWSGSPGCPLRCSSESVRPPSGPQLLDRSGAPPRWPRTINESSNTSKPPLETIQHGTHLVAGKGARVAGWRHDHWALLAAVWRSQPSSPNRQKKDERAESPGDLSILLRTAAGSALEAGTMTPYALAQRPHPSTTTLPLPSPPPEPHPLESARLSRSPRIIDEDPVALGQEDGDVHCN